MSTTEQTIWREGERVRRTDGSGYADFVADDHIRGHIERHVAAGDDPLFVAFAEAVLAIRAFERASRLESR